MKRIEIDDSKYEIEIVESTINGMDNIHIYVRPKDGWRCYTCDKSIQTNHPYDWNIIDDKKMGEVLICRSCKETYYTIKVFEREDVYGMLSETFFRRKNKKGTKHYTKPPMVKVLEVRKVLNERNNNASKEDRR